MLVCLQASYLSHFKQANHHMTTVFKCNRLTKVCMNNRGTTKTKTETISFRLPSLLIDELRKEAEFENVTLNAFVTKIFSNHVKWERYERKVGLLPMTKVFLEKVINQLTNEQIIDLAQKIEKEYFKNILTVMKQRPTTRDFVDVLRTWLTVSWMQHNIVYRNQSYLFNIQHDLGIKWSLYVKTLVSGLSEDILAKKVEININENIISLTFPEES